MTHQSKAVETNEQEKQKKMKKKRRSTWVPDSSVNSVALLKQQLDQQRCNVSGATYDTSGLFAYGLAGHGFNDYIPFLDRVPYFCFSVSIFWACFEPFNRSDKDA